MTFKPHGDLDRDPLGTRFRRDGLQFDPCMLELTGFPKLGRRFILWRTFPPRSTGSKPAKLPVSVWGYPMDGTNERNWLDFYPATRWAARLGFGLGVALGWGLGGLDLDGCIDGDGELSDRAKLILRHFPTYVEVSPSGRGVKAYFTYDKPFSSATVKEKGIELYSGRRFFALTGECAPLAGQLGIDPSPRPKSRPSPRGSKSRPPSHGMCGGCSSMGSNPTRAVGRTRLKTTTLSSPTSPTTAGSTGSGCAPCSGGIPSPIADCTANAHLLAATMRPPAPPARPTRPPAPPSADAARRLADCEPVRERQSHLGGTLYTLRRCPFTGEEHTGGGPYAIAFADGGMLFRCERSSHGPRREWVPPAPSRGRWR